MEEKASLSSERGSVLLDTAKEDCHRLVSLINELMEIVRLEAMIKPAMYGRLDVASLADVEKRHIQKGMLHTRNLDEAARILGINATTLWRKRKQYGFD